MNAIIRTESRRRFEKQGLDKVRQALKRGIANPTEKAEAQNWIVEEEGRQQRQRRRHLWWLLGFIIIVILGAVVSAWRIMTYWASR